MSGILAGKVWLSDLDPELKPLAATIADLGNDDGTSIHPSIDYVQWRLGVSDRTVRRHLATLRRMGILLPVCHDSCIDTPGRVHANGVPVHYQMVESALPQRTPWAEVRAANMADREAASAAKRDTPTGQTLQAVRPPVAPDPSSDPSVIRSFLTREVAIALESLVTSTVSITLSGQQTDALEEFAEHIRLEDVPRLREVLMASPARSWPYLKGICSRVASDRRNGLDPWRILDGDRSAAGGARTARGGNLTGARGRGGMAAGGAGRDRVSRVEGFDTTGFHPVETDADIDRLFPSTAPRAGVHVPEV